jgi:glycine cleavage system aminomethyltransferase T
MGEADEEALDLCALENFFFDITKEGVYNLNPMELQLQWRLSSQKTSYPGANEILKYRQEGWDRRMVSFVSPSDIKVNASITHDGKEIGKVLVIGYSPVRGEFVGKALLNKPYWHAGLDMMQVDNASIQTISAPAIDNLSLKVSPYRNSFSTRDEDLT